MDGNKVYVGGFLLCNRRKLDIAKVTKYFELNGCKITKKAKDANLMFVMTCGFYDKAEEVSFEHIKKLSRYDGELFVLGCLPETAPSRFKRQFSGKFLSTKNLCRIDNFFPDFKHKFQDIDDANNLYIPNINPNIPTSELIISNIKLNISARELIKRIYYKFDKHLFGKLTNYIKFDLENYNLKRKERKKAIIRIANGCMGKCSYCVIRSATGRLKSKPMDTLLREYSRLLTDGKKNFSFVAEDTGAYGLDIGSSLPELLQRLSEIDKGLSIGWEINTLNPPWLIKYKDSILPFVRSGKIRYMEIDVQSGSQRILSLMNRKYDVEKTALTINELKEANPKLHIYSQFMVGFPSETDMDFQETLNFIRRSRIDTASVFQYSDMEGAISSELDQKIPDSIKDERYLKMTGIIDVV
jgi:tRNA A37 methylthiotransferase MiaB